MRRDDCPLCIAPGGALVWQDARVRVVLADEPDYPGFCRLVWQAHIAELSDLDAGARAHLFAVLDAVERVVRRIMACDKINLASLGNQVAHLHWHVIPRYRDDVHFPQAIWAAPQRAVPEALRTRRQALAAALPAALVAELQSLFGPAVSAPSSGTV